MCKLIRTKSGVLALALETQYVTEIFERASPRPVEERADNRVRIMVMDGR